MKHENPANCLAGFFFGKRNAITDVVNETGGNAILASQLFGNSPAVACKNYYTGVDTGTALTALNTRKFS